ncbi:MAG: hypothetical protein FJY83_11600, partial [Candidatus Aminicenantes bacterium]|nr:hypothetical protein [Candidatus Aminicenantes bacterium]
MTRRDALSAAAVVIVLAGLPSGCRPPAVRLQPPDEVRSLEGYASLRLSGEGNAAKARISFLVRPPDRARVEVIDALGRVVLSFVLNGPEALLVVPAERVYCEADSREVTARFLGFALSPEEMAAVLSGVWPGAPPGGGGPLGWRLERDARNRVRRGSRGGASFEV